ncbi:MAG: tetratricopeptide repeat protein, partial [Elusimicrobia bacterium]|nr:tetratricopeptide repeat protein [Elusimicrobiota bacterium]
GGEIKFNGGKGFRLPPSASAAEADGIRLLNDGSYDEAIESFDRSLKLAKKNPGARANRGVALAQLGRLDEALKDFEAAVSLAPDLRPQLKGPAIETRVRRARARLAGGNVKGALDDLFIAIRVDRKDPRSFAAIAEAARTTRQYQTCVNYASRAIALGDAAESRGDRGACLAALGRKEDALKDFDAAIAFDPERGEYYLGRAVVLLDLHRKAAARKDAHKAALLDSSLAERIPTALR